MLDYLVMHAKVINHFHFTLLIYDDFDVVVDDFGQLALEFSLEITIFVENQSSRTDEMKKKIQAFLRQFSFRTGVIVLLSCIPCYIISFAQMALPISTEAKGVLWFVFFGLAKTLQYGGLTILGVEGVKRLKDWWKQRRG